MVWLLPVKFELSMQIPFKRLKAHGMTDLESGHGTVCRSLTLIMSRAATGAGTDGLMIEVQS